MPLVDPLHEGKRNPQSIHPALSIPKNKELVSYVRVRCLQYAKSISLVVPRTDLGSVVISYGRVAEVVYYERAGIIARRAHASSFQPMSLCSCVRVNLFL